MFKFLGNIITQIRPLRVMLAILALITIIFAPEPGTRVSMQGVEVFQTLLIPTVAPLVFLVLLLDALMGRVWMIEAESTEKKRMAIVVKVDLFLAFILLLIWVPYFIKIWN